MQNRRYSLDFLKIIATMLILAHHYQQIMHTYYDNRINFYGGKFYFGYLVEFFFIISGYVMTGYIDKINENMSFKNFVRKRAGRLLPLLTCSVIIYQVLIYVYSMTGDDTWLFEPKVDIWGSIITSLGLSTSGLFQNPMINNPAWYVSVLLICYVVFFVLTKLSKHFGLDANYLYVLMIAFGFSISTYAYEGPFISGQLARGYICFFWGLILGQYIKRRKNVGINIIIDGVILISILWIYVFHNDWIAGSTNYILIFLFYTPLICLFENDRVASWSIWKLCKPVVDITYDVYIWHCPFLLFLFILKAYGINVFHIQKYSSIVWFIVICFVIGWISNKLIGKIILKNITKKITGEEN